MRRSSVSVILVGILVVAGLGASTAGSGADVAIPEVVAPRFALPDCAPQPMLECALPWLAPPPAITAQVAAETQAGADDCASGQDAPGNPPGLMITPPAACSGTLSNDSDLDAYGIDMDGTSLLRLRLAGNRSFTAALYDAGYPWAFAWAGVSATEPRTVHVRPSPGVARVVLDGYGTTGYDASFQQAPFADSPDCGAASDAPDYRYTQTSGITTTGPPTHLAVPSSCSGRIDLGDGSDAYIVSVPGDQVLRASLSRATHPGYIGLFLLPLDAADWWYDLRGTYLQANETEVSVEVLDTGRTRPWLVLVLSEAWQSTGESYTISFSSRAPLPSDDCGSGRDLAAADDAFALAPGVVCMADGKEGDLGDSLLIARPSQPSVLRLTTSLPLYGQAIAGPQGAPWAYNHRSAYDAQNVSLAYLTSDEPAEDFRIHTTIIAADPAAYRVQYEYLPDPQDDCGIGHDAPRTRAARTPIVTSTCRAQLLDGDSQDVLRFPGGDDEMVQIDISPGSGGSVGGFFRAEGRDPVYADGYAPFAARFSGEVEGALFGHSGGYDVRVTRVPASAMDDCGSGDDVGSRDTASEGSFSRNLACDGELTTRADASDAFAVALAPGDLLVVRLDGAGTLPYIIDTDDRRVGTWMFLGLPTNMVAYRATTAGTHHVEVRPGPVGEPLRPYSIDARVLPAGLL